jgi:hypothetical protein
MRMSSLSLVFVFKGPGFCFSRVKGAVSLQPNEFEGDSDTNVRWLHLSSHIEAAELELSYRECRLTLLQCGWQRLDWCRIQILFHVLIFLYGCKVVTFKVPTKECRTGHFF